MLEETSQQPKKDEQVTSKRWYVLRTETGYEKYVQNALQRHIELHNLQSEFGGIMVPSEEVVEIRAGQKRRMKRKFYPGYVFVEINMNDQLWHFVKSISHVLGFIGGTPERPAPVSEKEVNLIFDRVKQGVNKPKPKVLFEPGESVRVISGPFVDFSAVVESVNYEKNRLKVSILIFGRSTLVELEFSQVKKDW